MRSYIKTTQLFSQASLIYFRLRRYLKSEYLQDLDFPEEIKRDYFYHSKYYNRAQQYIHANHFFGELLCIVRGNKMTKEEMHRFVCLSSCAPVFDDFFENNSNTVSIRNLMNAPNIENAQSKTEMMAAWFFHKILNDIKNRDEILIAANKLFDAQLASKSQKNKSLNSDELLEISLKKGGFSGLMYGLLLSEKKPELFLELAYQLGAYGQLMDDIFDLYDDAKTGIRTFANQSHSMRDIRMILEEQEQKIFDLISKMHLRKKNRSLFENVMAVFSSVIEMALNQYESIEMKMKIKPSDCLKTERVNWIVDMEKVSSVWKLFKLSSERI